MGNFQLVLEIDLVTCHWCTQGYESSMTVVGSVSGIPVSPVLYD
jgi:hypothetical protein